MKTSAKVAVACGCAIISSSAFAASRASASISELHFQVVDLDPTDGYTFQFESIGKTVLSLVASGTSSGESDSFGRIRTGWLAPGVFESQIDYVPVQARIDADGISLAGRADAGGGYNAEGAVGQDIPWNSGNLSLSGQTMLIVTAYAKVSVEATNPTGCDSSAGYCSASEVATAWASMQMSYSYATETTGVSSSFNDGLRLEAFATPAPHQPIMIAGKNAAAVLVSAEDWAAIQETMHLLSVPGMRESIRKSMAEPLAKSARELKW